MKKYCFALLLFLSGCGSGGVGLFSTSEYEGYWVGSWVDSVNKQYGTLEMVIGTNGELSGNTHNITLNSDGVFTGTVANNGDASAGYKFPLYPNESYTLSGKITINSNGHLVGFFQEYYRNIAFGSLSVDLVKQ
jgi:hypothetical protein